MNICGLIFHPKAAAKQQTEPAFLCFDAVVRINLKRQIFTQITAYFLEGNVLVNTLYFFEKRELSPYVRLYK